MFCTLRPEAEWAWAATLTAKKTAQRVRERVLSGWMQGPGLGELPLSQVRLQWVSKLVRFLVQVSFPRTVPRQSFRNLSSIPSAKAFLAQRVSESPALIDPACGPHQHSRRQMDKDLICVRFEPVLPDQFGQPSRVESRHPRRES